MKTIELPCYNIILELDESGGGSISSNMQEGCPKCGIINCDEMVCKNEIISDLGYEIGKEHIKGREDFNNMMDALESLILGHACADIDITTPAYLEGIESAVQSCGNNT